MKVVIIDDDSLVTMSLKTILEAEGLEVAGVGGDGAEALLLYKEHTPDVMLMDIRMENVNGVDGAKNVLAQYPDAKILFLTTFTDDEYIMKALDMGVRGYILKQDFAGLVPAINAVFEGQTVFGGKIVSRLPRLMRSSEQIDYEEYGITDKEYEIIQLVAQGLSNKEIASKTFLSEGTVRNYLSVILEKLNLRDRTQLAVFYLTGECGKV